MNRNLSWLKVIALIGLGVCCFLTTSVYGAKPVSSYDSKKSQPTPKIVVIDDRMFTVDEDVVQSTKHGREFVVFLKRDESVVGWFMHWQAKRLGTNLGLADARYDLRNQKNLPHGIQNAYLVYAGTVLCDQEGNLGIPLLRFDFENGWVLLVRKLGSEYHSGFRLARSK